MISSTRVRTRAAPAQPASWELKSGDRRDVGVGPEDDLRPLQSLAKLPRPITARSAGAPAAKLDPPQRGHAGLLEVSPRPVQIAAALPGPGPEVHNFQSARRGSDPGAFLQDTPRRSECNHQIVAAGADGCLDDSVDGAGFSHADRPEDQGAAAVLRDQIEEARPIPVGAERGERLLAEDRRHPTLIPLSLSILSISGIAASCSLVTLGKTESSWIVPFWWSSKKVLITSAPSATSAWSGMDVTV